MINMELSDTPDLGWLEPLVFVGKEGERQGANIMLWHLSQLAT